MISYSAELELELELERGETRLGVAGKVYGGDEARRCLEAAIDFVLAGRAAILHHDIPKRVREDVNFRMAVTPVSRRHLAAEGLGEKFIEYMSGWKGFVEAMPVDG